MGLLLIMKDFNPSENHCAEYETILAAATSNDPSLEREMLSNYLIFNMNKVTYHIGYNNQVYPRFRIQEAPVLTTIEESLAYKDGM